MKQNRLFRQGIIWFSLILCGLIMNSCISVFAPHIAENNILLLRVFYFLKEILTLAIPALSAIFFFILWHQGNRYFYIFGTLSVSLLSIVMHVIESMFFCHLWTDEWWGGIDMHFPYILEKSKGTVLYMAILILSILIAIMLYSKMQRNLKKEHLPTSASVSRAILIITTIFFLTASSKEMIEYTIPELQKVTLGTANLLFSDAVYIVFKYVFYLILSIAFYFIGLLVDSRCSFSYNSQPKH